MGCYCPGCPKHRLISQVHQHHQDSVLDCKLNVHTFQALQRFCDLYNPVEHWPEGNSAYVCTRRLIRTVAFGSFTFVLLTTAFLYAKIVKVLKSGVGNASRKKTLTVAFICLWFFWFIQSAPFILYDFYEVWNVNQQWRHAMGFGPLMGEEFYKLTVIFKLLAISIFSCTNL